MYSDTNRNDDNTAAGLIRNAFYGKEYSVSSLGEYAYYQNLSDMIDFSSISFNKAIKTTKIRALRTEPGLINYKLSDKMFDINIGDRVLSDEIEENGAIPIYSANVFEEFGRINKQNLTDFSVPSIIWGIDGDWMVNVIPEGVPFYPTDHCGVLRVHHKDIIPDYLAIALEVAGQYEKFSRYNRASTQRIKGLTVQIPLDKNKQVMVVKKVNDYKASIRKVELRTQALDEELKEKFYSMFDASRKTKGTVPLDNLCENLDSLRKPITEHHRERGDVPYYGASGVVDYVKEYIFDEDLLLVSEDGANLVTRKTPIAFSISGKAWVNNHAHILRFENSYIRKFIEIYLNTMDLGEYINKNANPKLTQQSLKKIPITLYDTTILKQFEKIYDEERKKQAKLSIEINKIRAKINEYILSVF